MGQKRTKKGTFRKKDGPPALKPPPPPGPEDQANSLPDLLPTIPSALAKDLHGHASASGEMPVPPSAKVPAPGELVESLDPVDPSDERSANWTRNHGLILDALDKYLRQFKRFPSYSALARITGVEHNTIKAHFDSYDWTRVRKKAQFLTEKLVYEMYEQIRSGKVKKSVLSLYFKIINQWRDGIDINIHGQYDFRFLGDRVKTASDHGDRTRNLVTFLSAINGRMGESSVRSN